MMTQETDRRSLAVEVRAVAEELRDRLVLMAAAGVAVVPRGRPGQPCQASWAIAGPQQAPDFSPCPRHGRWSGAAVMAWSLAPGVAALWAAPVAGAASAQALFSRAGSEQLGRMLEWLSGQLKAARPDPEGGALFLAGRCAEAGQAGPEDAAEAVMRCAPLVEGWLQGLESRLVLAMGAFAAGVLCQAPEPGAPHEAGGRTVLATHCPDALVDRPGLKKEALAHLNTFLGLANPERH